MSPNTLSVTGASADAAAVVKERTDDHASAPSPARYEYVVLGFRPVSTTVWCQPKLLR